MKKVIAFTIADDNNMKYAKMFEKTLRKFHSEKELPLLIVDGKWLDRISDNEKFYKMTPLIAKDLIREYELVLKFDADQLVTGDLSHIIEDDSYDIGCVFNSNPKEPQFKVWDISPGEYLNCGFVAMRSRKLVDHWWSLCRSARFKNYQFREQDLMNIIYYYGDYRTRNFDMSDNWHGLIHKGWWAYMKMKDGQLILPPTKELANRAVFAGPFVEWPPDGKERVIKIIHWAGGNMPNKMNYRIHFQPDVVKYLDKLLK